MNEEKQLMKAKLQQERREKKALEVKREKIHQKMVKDDFINRKKEKVAPSKYCISLQHINKIYPNHVQAVFDFNLDIKEKEFIVLVGPSGCGKSTTLRMVAGLEDITYGDFYITGRYGNDLLPKQRDIAMVFQNYALYPNMTVYDNMAFSLRVRHMPKDEIDKKVQEAAEILGIKEYLHRKPSALSGGQRQRVALGRAIVRNAKVFLMDEPLSNLDAKLRVQMRSEIIKLHKRVGSTTLYVTHDQTEAMTMASRIVVMKDGYIQQIGVPKEIYNKPSNIFVATFIGAPAMNILDAQYNKGVIVLKNGFKYELSPDLVKKHDKFYVDMKSEYEKRIRENEAFIEEKRADYADLEALKDRDNYDKVRTKEESKIIDLQAAVRYFRKEKLELEEQNASQRAIDAKEQKIQEYEQKIVVAQEEMNKKLADLEAQNENRKVERKNRDNAKLEQLRSKCSEAEYEQKVKQLEEEKLQRIEENLDKDDLVLLARLDNEKYRRIIEQVDEVIEKKVHGIKFGVRPEDVVLESKSVYLKNKSKTLQLNADLTELMGNEVYVHCNLGEQDVIAKVDAESNVEAGDKLKFVLNVEHTHIFDTISTNRVI